MSVYGVFNGAWRPPGPTFRSLDRAREACARLAAEQPAGDWCVRQVRRRGRVTAWSRVDGFVDRMVKVAPNPTSEVPE